IGELIGPPRATSPIPKTLQLSCPLDPIGVEGPPCAAPPASTRLKVARRADRKIVLTVRSATARRRVLDPWGRPARVGPPRAAVRPPGPVRLRCGGRASGRERRRAAGPIRDGG